MLLRFSVANFMSIRDRVEFSMVATSSNNFHLKHTTKCGKYNVLKGSYLFGANASGKSTFIKAMCFLKEIVLYGMQSVNVEKKYFRLSDEYAEKPGIFQVDFWTNKHVYSYGLAISYKNAYILEEWLYELKDDEEKCIFYRGEDDKGNLYCDTDLMFSRHEDNNTFAVYRKGIQNKNSRNIVFLKDMYMHIDEDKPEYRAFVDVIKWLRKVIIVFPQSSYRRITSFLCNDKNKDLRCSLHEFDTGVEDVKVIKKGIDTENAIPQSLIAMIKQDFNAQEKNDIDKKKAIFKSREDLLEIEINHGDIVTSKLGFNHGNKDDLFELKDESDGTRRLVHLLPLLKEAQNGNIVFIDEIDRSLHTMATMRFIEKFYELSWGHDSQIIATTQDANLLDLDKVRQDEIWFIERNLDHSSRLYPLSEYAIKHENIRDDYLLGRYGGIPKFIEQYMNMER